MESEELRKSKEAEKKLKQEIEELKRKQAEIIAETKAAA